MSPFRTHLKLAHQFWESLILPGDLAVDATCGNGHDTLFLAKLPIAKLYALDLQAAAIAATRQRLVEGLSASQLAKVQLIHGSHTHFPEEIHNVKLIVYNLGYLPGGDKSLTTRTETTLASLQLALERLKTGGAISLTCYPGHDEGAREEEALLAFVRSLDKKLWSCSYHQWINRKQAPSLLFLQKLYP
jgi:SAM-dependent methyltransferase